MAAALLFGLHDRPEVFIGLPEVIKGEVELHLTEKKQAAQRDLTRAAGELRQIFGQAQEVEAYGDPEVQEALEERLVELDSLVEILPATDEDLAEAGRMVLAYQAPSTRKSQQYRDSVIWRIAVRQAKENDVYLVTSDNGFYRNADSDELAEQLGAEMRESGISVKLFRNVEAILNYWSSGKPSLRTAELLDIVSSAVAEELSSVLMEHGGFIVHERVTADIDVYLTEVHDEVAVSGIFEYYLVDPEFSDVIEPPAVAEVRGTATVGLDGPEVLGVSLDSVRVDALTPHGTPNIARIVFGETANISRIKPYRLRVKVDLP